MCMEKRASSDLVRARSMTQTRCVVRVMCLARARVFCFVVRAKRVHAFEAPIQHNIMPAGDAMMIYVFWSVRWFRDCLCALVYACARRVIENRFHAVMRAMNFNCNAPSFAPIDIRIIIIKCAFHNTSKICCLCPTTLSTLATCSHHARLQTAVR